MRSSLPHVVHPFQHSSIHGFVLLQLEHDVMDIDEFIARRAIRERLVREDLLKALMQLDQLREGRLKQSAGYREAGKGNGLQIVIPRSTPTTLRNIP